MNTRIRLQGRARRVGQDGWDPVTCYVEYRSAVDHLDAIRCWTRRRRTVTGREWPFEVAMQPHNVAEAICMQKFFRERELMFAVDGVDYPPPAEIPVRPPEHADDTFRLWVNGVNGEISRLGDQAQPQPVPVPPAPMPEPLVAPPPSAGFVRRGRAPGRLARMRDRLLHRQPGGRREGGVRDRPVGPGR